MQRSAIAESNMMRRNEGDAMNLAQAARNSEISMVRTRDDAVWGYDVGDGRWDEEVLVVS